MPSMKAKHFCEICDIFKVVGFSDCGLICESCFQKEIMVNVYNQGVEATAELVGLGETSLEAIRKLKKATHRKDSDVKSTK